MKDSITKKCNKCGEIKSEFDSLHKSICLDCYEAVTKQYIKPKWDNPLSSILSSRKKNVDRYVYLISGGEYVKIGIAGNVKKRLNTLSLASPVPLFLLYSFYTEKAFDVEQYLHKKYHNKRVHGEWFSLNDNDIEWIKSRF